MGLGSLIPDPVTYNGVWHVLGRDENVSLLIVLFVHDALIRSCSGAKGIRTPDLLIANETRYQLRHSPEYRTMVAPASGGVANRHCPTALGQWLSSSMSQSAGAARRGFGPSRRSAVGMMTVLATGADRSMVRTVRGTSGFET